MLRTERDGDFNNVIIQALQGFQSQLWTAMPGYINSFNPVKQTAEIKVAIQWQQQFQDGSYEWKDFTLLLDVPICFPSGGGFTLTFPIVQGDEVLVVFASRCIDGWWQLGPESNLIARQQAEFRMHDLSDGFAILAPKSVPKVIGDISATGVQLRSDDGTSFVEIDDGTITLKAVTEVIVQAPQITLEADTKIDVVAPTINLTADTTVAIDSPATTVSGTLTVEGLLTYQAGIAGSAGAGTNEMTGDFTLVGNIDQTGSINQSGGNITSNGKVLATHTHGGVTTGGGTSGPPS